MNIVCPHCDGPIINTPDTAGQIAACPHCDKRLNMPPLGPAAKPPAPTKPPTANKPPLANKPPVKKMPPVADDRIVDHGLTGGLTPLVNTGAPRIRSQSTAARYRDSRRRALAAGGGVGVFFVIMIVLRVLSAVLRSADRSREQRERRERELEHQRRMREFLR